MSQTVLIPTPLRSLTNGRDAVQVEAATVGEVIAALEKEFPGIKGRLCDDDGGLRRYVNVYVDGEDVRFLEELETKLEPKAEVSIVPAIAGG